MSKLKVIDVDKMADVRSLSGQYYPKSEADKVIAELKKACNSKDDWCLHTLKEIRHQKYKRCLAMAEWCKARYDEEDAKLNRWASSWDYVSKEMKYWERWQWRWEELADKFKEAK